MTLDAAKRTGLAIFGATALFLGVSSNLWLIGMVDQWLIPWKSLALISAR